MTAMNNLPPATQNSYQISFAEWCMKYFDWFGATGFLGEDGTGDYSFSNVQQFIDVVQPEEEMTVVFNEYAPKGWMGWCSTPSCAGEFATSIVLGYEYNA